MSDVSKYLTSKSAETRQIVDIISFMTGLLVDHCRPNFLHKDGNAVFFHCPSRANIIIVQDKIDHQLYFLLQQLFRFYLPLKLFSEDRKLTFAIGLNHNPKTRDFNTTFA